MKLPGKLVRSLSANEAARFRGKRRRIRKAVLLCESLEGRVTPAHFSIAHHAVAHLHHAHDIESAARTGRIAAHTVTALNSTNSSSSSSSSSSDDSRSSRSESSSSSSSSSSDDSGDDSRDDSDSGSSSSSNSSSAVSTAFMQLRSDVLTIEKASGVTVGQLATIASAFETLRTDGISPSSHSALKSFENTLVTDFASGNTNLLSQFESIYTSSPTAQETTDLMTAYNALASAVTSSNITSADITTINTDWSALLSAKGSSSISTYPYFDLVTGQAIHQEHGFGGDQGEGGGDC